MKRPRPVANSESIYVPLVLSGNGSGSIITLLFDVMADPGTGDFYPDPRWMSFIERDEQYREAENNALDIMKREVGWPGNGTSDIRWRLTRTGSNPLHMVQQGSAGGAYAIALLKLAVGAQHTRSV